MRRHVQQGRLALHLARLIARPGDSPGRVAFGLAAGLGAAILAEWGEKQAPGLTDQLAGLLEPPKGARLVETRAARAAREARAPPRPASRRASPVTVEVIDPGRPRPPPAPEPAIDAEFTEVTEAAPAPAPAPKPEGGS